MVSVAGGLIALGSLLPWLSVDGVFSSSQSGLEFTKSAVVVLLIGLGVAFIGLVGLNVNRSRLVFWAGVLVILLTGAIHLELSDRIDALNENALLIGNIGAGIWVVYAGAAIGIIAGALYLEKTSAPLLGPAVKIPGIPGTTKH